jgi:hypothetical protein
MLRTFAMALVGLLVSSCVAYALRAFQGDHEINVSAAGKQRNGKATIEPGGSKVSITLE